MTWKIYDDFVHAVTVDGKAYRVFPFWNRVIAIYDLQNRSDMTGEDIIAAQAALLTNSRRRIPTKTASKIISETFSLMGVSQEKSDGQRVCDFIQDGPLIYAAFWQTYGIDLQKERDRLHFQAFMALFSSLPDNTRIVQVMDIRRAEIPAPNKHNRKEIARLLELKRRWALKKTPEEEKERLENGLRKIYEMLYAKAKGGE